MCTATTSAVPVGSTRGSTETRDQVPSSYLDELEGVLGELLLDMGAADPRQLAGHITRFSLQGQHATVVALLETAALPPPTQGW